MAQATFTTDGEKITIKVRQKTHLGNFYGWGININGQQFNILNVLHKADAIDKAFAKWLNAKAPTPGAVGDVRELERTQTMPKDFTRRQIMNNETPYCEHCYTQKAVTHRKIPTTFHDIDFSGKPIPVCEGCTDYFPDD